MELLLKLGEADESLTTAIAALKALQELKPDHGGRSIAIAITEIETGLLWLTKAAAEMIDPEGNPFP